MKVKALTRAVSSLGALTAPANKKITARLDPETGIFFATLPKEVAARISTKTVSGHTLRDIETD